MSDLETEKPEKTLNGREIEAKFFLRNQEVAGHWRSGKGFVAGFALGESEASQEVDIYFDTADFGLLRRGFTLRLRNRERNGVAQQIVGYKDIDFHTPRGVHSRIEVEETLEAPLPIDRPLHLEALPQQIAGPLVESLKRQEGKRGKRATLLTPIARVQQTRHKMLVTRVRSGRSGGGRRANDAQAPLGELSIDDLCFSTPALHDDEKAVEWVDAGAFCMAEVEILAAARRNDLRTLAGKMQDVEGVESAELGKLQLAVLAAADARLDAITSSRGSLHPGTAHTAEFCRAIWGTQLAAMLVNEAGVRESDDIEYVHQMRVATRRARAAMRLYAGFFAEKNRAVQRFARALRTTGRLLGRVRDLDVAAERLQSFANEQDANKAGSRKKKRTRGVDASIRTLEESRTRAHADLVEWLDSEKYARFVVRFAAFCATPGKGVASIKMKPGETPTPVQLRHTLPSMVWSRFEAVRAFEPLFEDAGSGGGAVPVETLHALRIECKYLRYHLEFAAPLLGEDGKALISAIKTLQEELGTLNDAVVGGGIISAKDISDKDIDIEPVEASDLAGESVDADADGKMGSSLPEATDDDTMALWHTQQQATIEAMRGAIPHGFAAFVGAVNRQRLANAVARL